MTSIEQTTLPNGLPLYRIAVPGTRATTILIAFDAGARTERADENGIAHFLEHLVFKGGEKYPSYRDVNRAAERIGAVLNAYTSHDLVAFHITVRAERALEAADLLTDFAGRPRIDADELDRERGVVVQEIARANDQPAMIAEHLIDQAAFGDHPLGRTVLGPTEHLRDTFTRDGVLAFRARRWSPQRGAAFVVGNLDSLPSGSSGSGAGGGDGELAELFGRFAPAPAPDAGEPAPAFSPRVLVHERDSSQSHLRMSYRPSIEVSDPRQRAALLIYSTLLGGSMGSRLFDEIREQRGLAYSVHSIGHAYADVPVLQLSAGLDSTKCVEAYSRMREIVTELRLHGPTEAEVERARAYAAGARAIAFENTGAVARHAAQQTIVYGAGVDPDTTIELLDGVSVAEVVEIAAGVPDELSVACVGPHTIQELESA
ncbi:MAG: M16 family metallopeptidase [Solirubrobacteraceae bacterium]